MNLTERLDKCGEFPAVSASLGLGHGVVIPAGRLFRVVPYAAPVVDTGLAVRMANLCSFHRAA